MEVTSSSSWPIVCVCVCEGSFIQKRLPMFFHWVLVHTFITCSDGAATHTHTVSYMQLFTEIGSKIRMLIHTHRQACPHIEITDTHLHRSTHTQADIKWPAAISRFSLPLKPVCFPLTLNSDSLSFSLSVSLGSVVWNEETWQLRLTRLSSPHKHLQ